MEDLFSGTEEKSSTMSSQHEKEIRDCQDEDNEVEDEDNEVVETDDTDTEFGIKQFDSQEKLQSSMEVNSTNSLDENVVRIYF